MGKYCYLIQAGFFYGISFNIPGAEKNLLIIDNHLTAMKYFYNYVKQMLYERSPILPCGYIKHTLLRRRVANSVTHKGR